MNYWSSISEVETIAEVSALTDIIQNDESVSTAEYDDYMIALSQISREIYRDR